MVVNFLRFFVDNDQCDTPALIAVIVPIYNESVNIVEVFEAVKQVFQGLPEYRFEMLFVDDGSTDDSWKNISELVECEPRVSGLCLSRNFGKELALTAGVESLQPVDAVICMDADLQHPPTIIPEFIRKWQAGADIVVGIRASVEDYSVAKKAGSKLFYRLMQACSDVDIPPNSTDFRLLSWQVVKTLCRFTERTRMFRGLIDWLGYKKEFVEFDAPSRNDGGRPSYSYKKLFALAINSITAFSLLPLRLTGYLGLTVSLFSSLLLLFMAVTDFFDFTVYTVLAYFVVFNTLLVGVMLSALGMVALYIGHIHTEVVARPLYVVREQIGELKNFNLKSKELK